jgi:hypothetical protein
VTTGQIYWGAVPFVVIQIIMVGIVIAFPGLVTSNLERLTADPSKIEIEIPTPDYEHEQLDTGPSGATGGALDRGDADQGAQRPDREGSGAEQGSDLEQLFKESK